ncbi:MAG: HAD family hydrolase [Candidatus Marinimicrobia bacterium]|nr:HAD family hydrolase [Candidatus Neomarinimicrobiota bacterium]MBT3575632.1 HAD family hydrolase [Candidatus Neomarinimicrobiota bacterium]MBT3679885.1 HAD family hydrolase [Candidatus Neomarinimicrobiota bacterium]MBT3952029.1 HAD family hydrolase [Candidatus Neomarinimicrobiota bacterium]MBT4251920.1 HAD family hydrolase [Candidatus Neomarinimicrobiota bacterium]
MSNFPYKHIMWDWNGTLLDDSRMAVMVINKTLAKRAMPTISHAHYQKIFGFPVIDYYRRLGFDFVDESFEVVGTEFIDGYEKHKFDVGLHAGVEEILLKLSSLRVSHSILSAYKQNTLDELVAHFGLTHRFLKIVGLNNHYAHSKVDNAIQLMSELEYDPSETLFVGDTEHDFEVAEAIGVNCVLIPGGHQTREALESTGAQVINNLVELLNLV